MDKKGNVLQQLTCGATLINILNTIESRFVPCRYSYRTLITIDLNLSYVELSVNKGVEGRQANCKVGNGWQLVLAEGDQIKSIVEIQFPITHGTWVVVSGN